MASLGVILSQYEFNPFLTLGIIICCWALHDFLVELEVNKWLNKK